MSKINEVISEVGKIEMVDENGFTNLEEKLFLAERALLKLIVLEGVPSGISVEEAEMFREFRKKISDFRYESVRDGRFDYDE